MDSNSSPSKETPHITTSPSPSLSHECQSIHNFTKIILPNGETIFSSFQSIEEISAYFSNILITDKNSTKLEQRILSDHSNNMSPKTLFRTTTSKSNKPPLRKIHKGKNKTKANPQVPTRYFVSPA